MTTFRSILGDTVRAVFDDEETNMTYNGNVDESSVIKFLTRRILESTNAAAAATTTTTTANVHGGHFTDRQCFVLMIIERISGGISLLGGLYIFQRAWKRRHCAFDRIMLSLSIHTILWGIYHLWGNAAIPIGTLDVYGAHGTSTTCTIQGFLFHISLTIPFYYVFLSCYSWAVIVQGNFDPARYEWIEKYIHFGVHVIPFGSAIYLLTIESFNANGLHCWIGSIPAGCGEGTGIECTRGPQNPHQILWIFAGIPAIFFSAFPTILMSALVIVVYRKQKKGSIPSVITAGMVARQSAIYLGSLYWIYLPLFVYYGLYNFNRSKNFGVAVWVSTVSVSLGLWLAIVYKYFSSSGKEPSAFSCDDLCDVGCGGGSGGPGGHRFSTTTHRSTGIMTAASAIRESVSNREECDVYEVIDGPEKSYHLTDLVGPTSSTSNHGGSIGPRDGSSKSNRSKRDSARWNLNTSGGTGGGPHAVASSRASQQRFSFNIFDGTASAGKFAAFIFDGDSEDEEKDLAETEQWAGCQNIIND